MAFIGYLMSNVTCFRLDGVRLSDRIAWKV